MYWPSPVVEGIQRANYDGSEVETVIADIAIPTHVAVDAVHRKAYWADWGGDNSIWRSNLDGTERELLVDDVLAPRTLEVDPLNGYYYWSEFVYGTIHRTSIADNWQTEVIFDKSSFGRTALPAGLAIDPVQGYLYATDYAYHTIIRMRLDGSDPTLWVTDGVYYPHAIAVDLTNERVIWSNENLAAGTSESANISSVDFQGLDQRIDFVPRFNPYIAGYVRHLAIADVAVPEPSTLVLVGVTAVMLAIPALNLFRARAAKQRATSRLSA